MNQIILDGITYADSDIVSGSIFSELSPIAETLGYGTLEAEVRSGTSDILQYKKNSPLTYWHDGILMGTYYVQRIKRTGREKYAISAIDALGLLANRKHYGGIYTGQTVSTVVADICGEIPATVKTLVADTRLYGWLPIATCRDNLRHVLFAIGCIARIDNNGVIRIEGLWDGVSQAVNKISMDASADYPSPVTVVKLTEHQFIASATSEDETLFEGVATANDIITFSDPVHSLTATGFSIVESNSNYAKVTAGTGTITGKKYVHVKRELIYQLTDAQDENEAAYEESTLVSIDNSKAVLERLAGYFLHQNSVRAEVRQRSQRCGDVANIRHPYDKEMVPAFLQSSEITISREMKANQSYLVGYRPTMPNNVIYESVAELISEDGQVTIPEGVTKVRAVLIGGGSGGSGGNVGGSRSSRHSYLYNSGTYGPHDDDGVGCSGGEPGPPGKGGKIKIIDIMDASGKTYDVHLGAGGTGGTGGIDGGTAPQEGTIGTDTTFGPYSSGDGTAADEGFLDIYSGISYGSIGKSGKRGGNGGGTGTGTGSHPGESLYGQSGGAAGSSVSGHGTTVQGGGGGGSAVGADGGDARSAQVSNGGSLVTYITPDGAKIESVYLYITGQGGNGATPVPADHAEAFGCGGQGGHGGGGAGHEGGARCGSGCVVDYGGYPKSYNRPGNGGRGGDGAGGCVILYYSRPITRQVGAVVERNKKYLLDRLGRYIVV